MTLYWVSCIIFDKVDRAPWTCSSYSGVTSYEEAIKLIDTYRKDHRVLSAWIDIFDSDRVKKTVYHESYVDGLGNIKEVGGR